MDNEKAIDRESAYEKSQARAGDKLQTATAPATTTATQTASGGSILEKALGTAGQIFQPTIGPRGGIHDSMATTAVKSVVRAASSQIGRQVVRGLLGGILGGGGRR